MKRYATEPLCCGRRVLVVGSAPGLVLPSPENYDVVLGANGGAALAQEGGFSDRTILVTTAHLFRSDGATLQERATRKSLWNRHFDKAWVDERNGPADWVFNFWCEHNLRVGAFRLVSPAIRDTVVEIATGRAAWVSTGVWATCLAVVSQARSVRVVGISLDTGHVGMPWDNQDRHHTVEDATTLGALVRSGGIEMSPNLEGVVA